MTQTRPSGSRVAPLPDHLLRAYQAWRSGPRTAEAAAYRDLADHGQAPQVMVIACCDSRVHPTEVLGARPGDVFMHRNIANLVPSHDDRASGDGTAAAVTFGVGALKVRHLIVMGHSACGGAKGCLDMCSGDAPDLAAPDNPLGRWLEILRPGYDSLTGGPRQAQLNAMERQTVIVSLGNLAGYPVVQEAMTAGVLSLHGLWMDIGSGTVEMLGDDGVSFAPV